MELTEDFIQQDDVYGKESMEEFFEKLLQNGVVTLNENENETKEDAIQTLFRDGQSRAALQELGYLTDMDYFDFEDNAIWATKELYDKHKVYLMTLEKKKSTQITPTEISSLGKKEMNKKAGIFSSLYYKVKSRLNRILDKDEKNRN